MIGVGVQSFVKKTVMFIILHLRIIRQIKVVQSIVGVKQMFPIQNFHIMFILKTALGWKIRSMLNQLYQNW